MSQFFKNKKITLPWDAFGKVKDYSKFFKKQPFFSEKEYECFNHLKKLFWHKYDILSKVRIVDIFSIDATVSPEHFWMFNRFSSKHIDFAIMDKNNEKPILVIELDWPSHMNNKSISSDREKELLFKAMGIEFLRIENKYLSESFIKQKVMELKVKYEKKNI